MRARAVRLAGLSFAVVPPEGLSPGERRALDRLPEAEGADAPSFVLEIADGDVGPSGHGGVDASTPDDDPAAVDWDGRLVTLRHRRVRADLDPAARTGRLLRDASVGWPLEVTLRTALACVLPLEGGLPLHAAGLVVGARGVAFFGPSGAGKSTLAAAAPGPVLSDEMVAVVPAAAGRYRLAGTGFWGTFEGEGPASSFPLAALAALDRGPGVDVSPVDPRTALRRLVASTLVPPAPPLWTAALAAIGALVRAVPVVRLMWSAHEPWPAVEAALERALSPRG